jgi:hypothetical protein
LVIFFPSTLEKFNNFVGRIRKKKPIWMFFVHLIHGKVDCHSIESTHHPVHSILCHIIFFAFHMCIHSHNIYVHVIKKKIHFSLFYCKQKQHNIIIKNWENCSKTMSAEKRILMLWESTFPIMMNENFQKEKIPMRIFVHIVRDGYVCTYIYTLYCCTVNLQHPRPRQRKNIEFQPLNYIH